MARAAVLQPAPTRPQVQVTDVPDADLGPQDVRVSVTCAGVNYWEIMQRHGRVPIGDPAVPGTEGSGRVVEAGKLVTQHGVGDRVAWFKVPGSYAEQVVGPAASFLPIADSVDDETAAGLLFQGVTAQYLSTDTWPLADGDLAVVTAASGGVGLLLTQLLVERGATVVGLVSSEFKRAVAEAAGARTVLTYGDRPSEQLRAAGVDGVSAVFDSVGGSVARDLVGTLRPRGAMVLYGSASGEDAGISSADLSAGSYFLTRAAGRDYARTPAEQAARAADVLGRAAEGRLRVHVGGTWPLTEAELAWDALESRITMGKLLLRP
jgi:NADPH2:quinone reductase